MIDLDEPYIFDHLLFCLSFKVQPEHLNLSAIGKNGFTYNIGVCYYWRAVKISDWWGKWSETAADDEMAGGDNANANFYKK